MLAQIAFWKFPIAIVFDEIVNLGSVSFLFQLAWCISWLVLASEWNLIISFQD